jgi:glycosyltransferase involved in cell wall biosynthesis
MDVTVVLCTYNRSESLARALESVCASVVDPAIEWELVVVDNNSSDGTRQVVRAHEYRHPDRMRYLFEPQPGKSHALNVGVREARGEVLAFVDDDVTVEPTWLQNLTTPLRAGAWAGAGGRILPVWRQPPPRWLPTNEPYGLAPLAVFDLGSEPGPIPEPPFGTNMAFRREMFSRYGGFRTDLGPRPGSQIRGEDTEFGRRLISGGEVLRYEPSAIVHHPVSGERLKKQYFLDWWFDNGRGTIRERSTPPASQHTICGIPFQVVRGVAACTVRWLAAKGAAHRFHRKTVLWTKLGEAAEYRNLYVDEVARRRTKPPAPSEPRDRPCAPSS